MPASALPHCLVVGTGYTGQRLLARLATDRATGLSRTHGVNVLELDLDTGTPWPTRAHLPGQKTTIVYTVPPAKQAANDRRLERFLGLLPGLPGRFVYLSTSGVYGDCRGELVSETAAPAPATERAQRRCAAEQHLQQWSAAQGVSTIILRVPGIYGPGRLGLERIRRGEPVLHLDEAPPGNRIHVDDLVSCCLAALADDVPAGIYNVGDGDNRSASWFSGEVARQAGLPAPAMITREQAAAQFSPMRLSFLNESRRLDLSKMHTVLQPAIRYPNAADGIAAALTSQL